MEELNMNQLKQLLEDLNDFAADLRVDYIIDNPDVNFTEETNYLQVYKLKKQFEYLLKTIK